MTKVFEGIFKEVLPGLQKTMQLTYRRNDAITANIANAETPQYRAVDLNFANELEKAYNKDNGSLLKTNAKHLDSSGQSNAHLVQDYSGATKADGNNVDLDIQMGRLAYNSGRYSIAAQLMRKHLQLLKTAIREGLR